MPTCCFPWKPNASLQLLPEAGAQRTLEAVSCKALFGSVQPKITLEQAVDLDLGELGGGGPKVDRLEPFIPWGRHEVLPHWPSDENPGVPGCGVRRARPQTLR